MAGQHHKAYLQFYSTFFFFFFKKLFEEEFEIKEVKPIVLNELNVETTRYDFFSKKSTNYEKALEVVHLHDENFKINENPEDLI